MGCNEERSKDLFQRFNLKYWQEILCRYFRRKDLNFKKDGGDDWLLQFDNDFKHTSKFFWIEF